MHFELPLELPFVLALVALAAAPRRPHQYEVNGLSQALNRTCSQIFKTLGSGNIIKDVPVRFRTKAGKIVPLLIDSNVAYKVDDTGEKAFGHTRCFIRDDTGRRVREARSEAMHKETARSLKLLDAFVSRTLHLVKTVRSAPACSSG